MVKFPLISLLLSLLIVHVAFSGEWDADSIARSIPSDVTRSSGIFASYLENAFPEDEERVKALYIWLAKEIDYDVRRSKSDVRVGSINELVDATLKTRKAVCQGFAEVFRQVCDRLGIKTVTIHGYTKMNGTIQSDLGHAWNASRINGDWYLFDATWGSGYVKDGRYEREFSWDYYKANPDSLLKTHMPFDPIWQLKAYPATHMDFLEGRTAGHDYYNYRDSIDLYFNQPRLERAEGSLRRANQAGASIVELSNLYRKFSGYISDIRSNYYIDIYNNAVHAMHSAVDYFNDYQKKKVKGKGSTRSLSSLLASSRSMAELANQQISQIEPGDYVTAGEIRSFQKDIRTLQEAISNEMKKLH